MSRRLILLRLVAAPVLLLASAAFLRAQETLLTEFHRTGWSLSTFLKFTDMDGESGVMLGGRLGLIYNGHITLGGYGGTRVDAGDVYLSQYGAFLEVDFRTTRLVHFSVGTLLGGGDAAGDTFFLMEPEGWMLLNLTQRTQVGVGISYRAVSTYDEPDGDLNGPGIGLIFKTGSFW
jgi:hypothetical protein